MTLYVSDLRNQMHTKVEIDILLAEMVPTLKLAEGIDALCFLKALVTVESSYGADDKPRYEHAFGPRGMYFDDPREPAARELRKLYALYGPAIACSYSCFQILYSSAIDFGFSKELNPNELWDAREAAPFVVLYLNNKTMRGAKTVEELAASYNGGRIKEPWRDNVKKYVLKFRPIYDNLVARQTT